MAKVEIRGWTLAKIINFFANVQQLYHYLFLRALVAHHLQAHFVDMTTPSNAHHQDLDTRLSIHQSR